MINLVDNAIKFSPVGGRIVIRVAETPRGLVLDVIDSGPGIEAESRTRIFDRFYRAATAAGGAPGSGLGLSIAKGAVESTPAGSRSRARAPSGCTFRITLPLRDAGGRRKAS